MRKIGLLCVSVLISLAAAPAVARDKPNPFSSGEASLAYAIDPGCLAWLRIGEPIEDSVSHASRPVTEDGKPARKVYGMGHVTLRTDASGGCYIRMHYGDPVKLRDTVLNTLAEGGLKVERLPASAGLAGRNWAFHNEIDCFRMDDKVFLVEIYGATTRRDLPLQATFSHDTDGLAAKAGLCQA